MYFSFFLSRKQGNNERVLLESLKSKYKNILLGFKELKQMKQEKAQEEKAQETTTVTGAANADTTNSVATQKYLQQIRNAIVKLATYICKKSSGQKQLAINGRESPLNYQLYDMTKDPEETTNLSAQYPEVVERLRQQLQSQIDAGRTTAGVTQLNDVAIKVDKWATRSNRKNKN